MALTTAQRADVRFFCGWSARFRQVDSALEQAMNALDEDAATLALFTNILAPLDGSPPGLIACCRDAMAQLRLAMKRKKATQVGTIVLNPQELENIRELGRQYAKQMCSILGVERGTDVFSSSGGVAFAYSSGGRDGGGNYIGK